MFTLVLVLHCFAIQQLLYLIEISWRQKLTEDNDRENLLRQDGDMMLSIVLDLEDKVIESGLKNLWNEPFFEQFEVSSVEILGATRLGDDVDLVDKFVETLADKQDVFGVNLLKGQIKYFHPLFQKLTIHFSQTEGVNCNQIEDVSEFGVVVKLSEKLFVLQIVLENANNFTADGYVSLIKEEVVEIQT